MNEASNLAATESSTVATLSEIVRRWGTPTYAYDLRRLRLQVQKLRNHLPAAVEILYSLKSNASLGISEVLASCGVGADVASAGELFTAVEAGFPPARIFVAGPYKSPETISGLRNMPEAIVSVDSASELRFLATQGLSHRAVLRLRPDFGSSAVVKAGPESRFGVSLDDLAGCRDNLNANGIEVIGFHVFAGSQVLKADGVIRHLRGAFDLSLRAADVLGISPRLINLGGGFGVPYEPDQDELDLAPVGEELHGFMQRAASTRLVLELGRYLVAQAGWYLTAVVGHQKHQDRAAVIVDGGTHQRADFCGLDLRHKAGPPLVLNSPTLPLAATNVLGCLSLPEDVLAEATPLPSLLPGDVLAFANAGAYGIWASATHFHGFAPPAEVAFDGTTIQLMRERQSPGSLLDGQMHVVQQGVSVDPT